MMAVWNLDFGRHCTVLFLLFFAIDSGSYFNLRYARSCYFLIILLVLTIHRIHTWAYDLVRQQASACRLDLIRVVEFEYRRL